MARIWWADPSPSGSKRTRALPHLSVAACAVVVVRPRTTTDRARRAKRVIRRFFRSIAGFSIPSATDGTFHRPADLWAVCGGVIREGGDEMAEVGGSSPCRSIRRHP